VVNAPSQEKKPVEDLKAEDKLPNKRKLEWVDYFEEHKKTN